ncbi:hypothetical protein ABZ612_20195 [Streptomyces avermitilis]|uniref:hypothetical protein n=1 Tax=Streptomyces avermitilis TaxID=33903 RepID=UPI0033F854F2
MSADRVRTLARNYSCADAPYVYALTTMTGARKRGWWEEHRDTLPSNLLDLGRSGVSRHLTRIAVTIHMPGPLHATEHARAAMREAVPL